MSFPRVLLLVALPALVGLRPAPAHGQVAPVDPEPDTLPSIEAPRLSSGDSAAYLREARAAQARFERRRVRHLPMVWETSGGICDEIVGRMCIRLGRGSDWEPAPEKDEVKEARAELLETLGEIADRIPGDDWVLGQRIHYLGEAGRWDEADALTRDCPAVSGWWCAALRGYVLHHVGRFPEAALAFEEALDAMEPERAEEWRSLERLLDSDGSRLYRSREGAARRALEERIWALANPLFLVPGNDHLTAHLSRHVASTIQERARNPHNIGWGSDLAEITVRYGTPYGWEQERARWSHVGPPRVLGRHDPRSRGLLPPGGYLDEPGALPPGEWTTDQRRVRARYAPEYAPRIHPLDPQVEVFRRGDSLLVIAAWEVEGSIDYEGADWNPAPEEGYGSGLFLLPVPPVPGPGDAPGNGGALEGGGSGASGVSGTTAETGRSGALTIRVPTGAYVVSLEALHAAEARAWRARHGVRYEPLPRGVIALSGLLLTHPWEAGPDRPPGDGAPHDGDPPALEEWAERALPRAEIPLGGTVGVVWEVYGLMPQDRTLRFRLSVGRGDRGLLRRAGEWLRLVEPEHPVVMAWSEPAPESGGLFLRAVTVDLEALEPGDYELRLELDPVGRTPAVVRRTIRITPGGP